jgi:hypothetical protein
MTVKGIDLDALARDAQPIMTPSLDGAAPAGRLRGRLHIGAAVCDLPAPTALVDGLLFVPGESAVYAPPKTWKTFFCLDIALSVATGTPFMGRDVQPSNVLYVVAEGSGGIGARVAAWRDLHHNADIDAAAFLTCAVNLLDPDAVTELCAIVAERAVSLVVLDTLARCTVGADENSARDMGRIVEALDHVRDTTDGHIQIVHHTGKDTTRGMRGSNALLGALDTVIELSGDADAIRVSVTAQKDAVPTKDWYCRLQPCGRAAALEYLSDLDVLTRAQHTVLEALLALPDEDRTATKWQQHAEDLGVGRTSFYQAKQALQLAGRVTGGGGRGALYHVVDES